MIRPACGVPCAPLSGRAPPCPRPAHFTALQSGGHREATSSTRSSRRWTSWTGRVGSCSTTCRNSTSAESLHDLARLLRLRPPTLRPVLASRIDPPVALPRVRLEGRLHEVRAEHLRFSRDETRALLRSSDLDAHARPARHPAHPDRRLGGRAAPGGLRAATLRRPRSVPRRVLRRRPVGRRLPDGRDAVGPGSGDARLRAGRQRLLPAVDRTRSRAVGAPGRRAAARPARAHDRARRAHRPGRASHPRPPALVPAGPPATAQPEPLP